MVNSNVYKDRIKDYLLDELNTKYTHFAVGTGTTPASDNDTTLENEVFRDVIDSVVISGDTVVYKCKIETSELNGQSISEIGIFDADTDGEMLCRLTFNPITKDENIEIWLEVIEEVLVE
jgi:hypothetical protein